MESPQPNDDVEPYVLEVLEPNETLRAHARARDAVIAVSDRRLIVAARERIALSIAFHELRRIQFDIERDKPATMVIVPRKPTTSHRCWRSHRRHSERRPRRSP
jgi:hypothetical protein